MAVAVLVVCEVLVVCGALEVRASLVAKVAPWAYEPFLRLVGEHPDQMAPNTATTNNAMEYVTIKDLTDASAATNTVFGALDTSVETNATSTPLQVPNEEPVNIETNTPAESPDVVIPVG